MDYDYFIRMIKNFRSSRIKAFNGQQSSTIERVPSAFGLLIPDIIGILDKNIDKLCDPDQGIVIFGMQPVSMMPISNEPMETERFLETYQPDNHFCCTLEYIIAPLNQIDDIQTWDKTNSVIVDFTSGKIMDSEYYISQVTSQPEAGQVYDTINPHSLSIAWTIAAIKQKVYSRAHEEMLANQSLNSRRTANEAA